MRIFIICGNNSSNCSFNVDEKLQFCIVKNI